MFFAPNLLDFLIKICYTEIMHNWSVDEKRFKKEDPEGYRIWRLEQMINWGLGGEKIPRTLLKRYWRKIFIDEFSRKYLKFLLWPKKEKF